ncbi:TonB-dependent receptor [Microbulbifer thermotolerans]|uniref:TonB-dependent receptor n=1 Tax=Microbulbifer thermotolerans TaxID=252514 RepID=A0AB35I0V8_MICTH|nr:TonB-dependent receptor [Microbulbifer thermotolerans]MCX2795427.1 TonB-dependent receptor [Microbulbifer thermotolerans]MCX2802729.1 TonB-dependent receptor [Microbulbifer thermotolerans]
MYKKKKLSEAIMVMAAVACSQPLVAQESPGVLEEVTVTGIRASLQRSMDIKRDASGVVDAISSEDIGKFPDTNLAESLQRITGVSINRVNGEGSEITVRGFTGSYNMVTLNGRTLPGGIAYGGGSGAGGTRGGGTRAFDFANLASESVSSVQVYKTSRSAITSGGIGATVNIDTAKPLDNPGMQMSIGGKVVNDTTNLVGDDFTPEVSGIFSWTDSSERFGVALSGSFQERDSGAANAAVNDWNIGTWGEDELYSFTGDAVIENAPDEGQLYARPNDLRYAWSDRHRERTNGQLTLQFRPMDSLTLTGDYTYAENYLQEHRSEQTFWFANGDSVDHVVFDDSAVATPVIYSEVLSGKDAGFEQQWREQTNTLESIGFNADWNVNETLSLRFDMHDSSMESLPSGPGNSGEIAMSIAAPILTSQVVNFGSDLPVADVTFDDSSRGNNNGVFDAGDFGTQVGRVWYAGQTTDITQVKLDGSLEFDDGRFDFGVESMAVDMRQQSSSRYMGLGDWGIANPGEIPEGLWDAFSLTGRYDDYNMSGALSTGFRGDPVALCNWSMSIYATAENDYQCAYDPAFTTNNRVEEDTTAVYFQVSMDGQLAGLPTNLLAGVRYETTDVKSSSLQQIPLYLLWQDNNDFMTVYADGDAELISADASYDHLLPSLDFSIDLRDDLKGRFSYSKTIARAGYSNLSPSVGSFGTVGSTYNGTTPTAVSSNPALLPLESDNLDLSLEWYYSDSSYVSAGFFEKRVDNFIGTAQVEENHFGMRDVTNGPRVEAAAQALMDRGFAVNDTSLFVMMAVMENPDAFPNGADDYTDDAQFAVDVATAYDLAPNDDDPLMIFRTSKPDNNKEAKIYGFEFAAQHFFGDTGFGLQANYTVVRGDVGFDVLSDPGVSQFALPGLSDTANLVAIYENYGFQARLAYNWRDSYLNEVNKGNSRNPIFVEAYSQVDLNVSYEVNENLDIFFEGLNLTEENVRYYGRSDGQLWYLEDLGARYQLGARYTF